MDTLRIQYPFPFVKLQCLKFKPCAIRYNLGRVGSLSDVVAPPYDVIGPELQDELYQKSPFNVVRLILNKILPGDDDEAYNRYTRAKRHFKDWQSEGILYSEPGSRDLRLSSGVYSRGRCVSSSRFHGSSAVVAVWRRSGLSP